MHPELTICLNKVDYSYRKIYRKALSRKAIEHCRKYRLYRAWFCWVHVLAQPTLPTLWRVINLLATMAPSAHEWTQSRHKSVAAQQPLMNGSHHAPLGTFAPSVIYADLLMKGSPSHIHVAFQYACSHNSVATNDVCMDMYLQVKIGFAWMCAWICSCK